MKSRMSPHPGHRDGHRPVLHRLHVVAAGRPRLPGDHREAPVLRGSPDDGRVPLPFTFVIDVATFPIQALLVVILGDNFPFTDRQRLAAASSTSMLDHPPPLPPAERPGEGHRHRRASSSSSTSASSPPTPRWRSTMTATGRWWSSAPTRATSSSRARSSPLGAETLVCER